MKYKLLLSLFICITSFSKAQLILLKGNIVDPSGQSISDADVFISNTSIHTTSENNGNFVLSGIPANIPFDIVVSRVGYKTFSKSFSPATNFEYQKIILVPNEKLNDVIIASSKLEKWNKWKKIFTETFIGTGKFANQCKILNPEVLKIYFNKQTNILSIHSVKPLQIRNKALGYLVNYALTDYRYDTSHFYLKYFGYPYFQQLEGRNKFKIRWLQNRRTAYKGSVIQFMREVYNDSLNEENFILINPTPEKKNVTYKEWQTIMRKRFSGVFTAKNHPADSMMVLMYDTLRLSQICFIKEGIKYMQFSKPVEVVCNNLSEDALEQKMRPIFLSKGKGSLISLDSNQTVSVWKDGSYFNPENLILQGLWAFTEKVSTLLPFDYENK